MCGDDERRKQAQRLSEVVGYIIGKHHLALVLPGTRNRWVTALVQRSERLNCRLSEGIIRQILKGDPGDRSDEVLGRLAKTLRMKPVSLDAAGNVIRDEKGNPTIEFVPYEPLNALSLVQLRHSLEGFKEWEKEAARTQLARAEILPDSNRVKWHYKYTTPVGGSTPLGHYELVLPARGQPAITRGDDEVHYVAWRYALETSPESPKIAREVVTFKREGNAFHATMTYKLGGYDLDQALRTFEGPVIPLGQSLMCVLTSADEAAEGWHEDLDRGRVIFMRRRPARMDHVARFGILATTRADAEYEPCCACVFMLLVDARIEDIEEFRRLVTVLRPAEAVLASDFGGLPERDQNRIKLFLENVPEGHRHLLGGQNSERVEDGEAEGHDRVLRLVLSRFHREMPRIREFIVDPKNKVMNPIIKDWRAEGVLLARADEEV